jgi:hypothetical protein
VVPEGGIPVFGKDHAEQGTWPKEGFPVARPENRSEARALSLTLPIETFNYLVLLATLGKLGRTENEVATHILVREAYAMHGQGFHEMRIAPPPDDEGK